MANSLLSMRLVGELIDFVLFIVCLLACTLEELVNK